MDEWLFLLLPVAAASGWYLAYRHYTQKYLTRHTHNLRQTYLRGLDYLLSERTDKAIEALQGLLTEHGEPVETHVALGNLYRRRGELEKAIEIHERIVCQDGITRDQRCQAQFELGTDYQRAGLLDRAEAIFRNLSDHPNHRDASLLQLLKIYEHEKDWRRAIDCTRLLQRTGKLQRGESIAQYLCEIAEETLAGGDDGKARQILESALEESPSCVRATLLMARVSVRQGRFEDALQTLRKVEAQDGRFLAEILEPLRLCHEHLERPLGEFLGYLGYLFETYGHVSVALALAEQLRSTRGAARSIEHLQRVIDMHPALKPLKTLSGLLLEDGNEPQRETMIRIDRALDRLAAEVPRYQCESCGFHGSELHWRCPSCLTWESTRPL